MLDTLRRPKEGVDITFWETLQQQLKGYMARSRLRERHEEILRQKLECLKQEQGIVSQPLFPAALPDPDRPSTSAAAVGVSREAKESPKEDNEEEYVLQRD